MTNSRRSFLKEVGAASVALAVPRHLVAEKAVASKKSHIITLSFDDGFKKSFTRTAEICAKYKLSACLNIVAAGFPENAYIKKCCHIALELAGRHASLLTFCYQLRRT